MYRAPARSEIVCAAMISYRARFKSRICMCPHRLALISTLSHSVMTATPKSGLLSSEVEEYAPLTWSINEIRAAIPKRLFERQLGRATLYLTRDLVVASVFWYLATWIDSPELARTVMNYGVPAVALPFIRWPLWLV